MSPGMRDFLQTFYNFVGLFFVLYMVGYASFLFLSVTVGSATLYGARRRNMLRNELSAKYYVPVSILVPAHNENVTVVDTVQSLLLLDYPLYEIIVVDDGSTDDTAQCLIDAFHLRHINRPIQRRLLCQPALGVFEGFAGAGEAVEHGADELRQGRFPRPIGLHDRGKARVKSEGAVEEASEVRDIAADELHRTISSPLSAWMPRQTIFSFSSGAISEAMTMRMNSPFREMSCS